MSLALFRFLLNPDTAQRRGGRRRTSSSRNGFSGLLPASMGRRPRITRMPVLLWATQTGYSLIEYALRASKITAV